MAAPRRPLLSFTSLSAPLVATISLGCNGYTSDTSGVCNVVCNDSSGSYVTTGSDVDPDGTSSTSAGITTGTSTDATGTGTGTDATGTSTDATGTGTDATGTSTDATGTGTDATGTGTTGTSGG